MGDPLAVQLLVQVYEIPMFKAKSLVIAFDADGLVDGAGLAWSR